MKQITAFTILMLGFFHICKAQLLDGQDKTFTHADSLRGGIKVERSCYDVTFYDLNIDLDFNTHELSGFNKVCFTARQDMKLMQLDLFDNMKIDSIMHQGIKLSYKRDCNAVFITLDNTLKYGMHDSLMFYYHGTPIIAKHAPWDGGFVWTQDKDGKPWLGVACEGKGASLWWPTKEYLGDECDSMHVTCTFPGDLYFAGNGQAFLDRKNADGTRTQGWRVTYPINNYNVTLNIGNYTHFSDVYVSKESGKQLDLDYYVMPYNLEKAKKQFTQVKPMLAIYEKQIGAYPFWNDGYALVETPYLGMEHQGAIAYGNDYLTGYHGKDFSRIGLDFDYIIIHESGHEWWGNSVSCKDIADMWIHESFCTYTEAIYVEAMYGKKKALEYINAKKESVGNKHPIVGVYGVNEEGDGDMYNKGMLFLNAVRTVVNNDSLWFGMLKDMATNRFYLKTVSYDDIVQYMTAKTHKDMKALFDQYLKHPNIPTLLYRIEDKNKFMKTFYYKWKVDVPGFYMKFNYQINGKKKDYEWGQDQWRSTDIRCRKIKKFWVDQDHSYINVEKF